MCREIGAGLRRGECRLAGRRQLAREHLADGRLGGRVRRVVDDRPRSPSTAPSIGRTPRPYPCRAGRRRAGRPSSAVAKLGGEAASVRARRGRDATCRRGRWRRPAPDRPRDARAGRSSGSSRSLAEDGARSHFVPIVVFGFDPEDRDRGHAVPARYLVGELERRDGFEQRVDRTAEEARLLAGQHGHGRGVGEPIGRRATAWAGAPRRRCCSPMARASC